MSPFLQSERLYFRRYERSDLDFLAGLFADPHVMRFIGNGALLDRAQTATRLERWLAEPPDRGFFLALTKADDTPVGHAALIVQSVDGRDEPEVGWWLARTAWGLGYAAEAGAVFRDYALQAAGFDRIIHLIAPGNERSTAVAQRIGSTFDRATTFRGNPVLVYGQRRNCNPASRIQYTRTPLASHTVGRVMDLTQTPPTSVKTQLHGIVQLARTIDKGKAKAHGNLGEYHYNCPMDAAVFSFLGIDHEALLDVISKAKSDQEIADYVAPFVHAKSAADIEAWNAEWLKSGPAPGSDSEKYFHELRNEVAPDRTDVTAWADLLDLDEKRNVPKVVAA